MKQITSKLLITSMDTLLQELFQINQPFQIMLSTSMEATKIQSFHPLPLLNKTDTLLQKVQRSASMSEKALVTGSKTKLQKTLLNGVTDNLMLVLLLTTMPTLKDQLIGLNKEHGESLINKSLPPMSRSAMYQSFCNGVTTMFQPSARQLIANANFKLSCMEVE